MSTPPIIPPRRDHIVIVRPPYDRLILLGRKRIESRLTHRRMPPYGHVQPGDRLYFKRSSGSFFAIARVTAYWQTDRCCPDQLTAIRRFYDRSIHGTDDYWTARQHHRCLTLIWFDAIETPPMISPPPYQPRHMTAWHTPAPGSATPGIAPGTSSKQSTATTTQRTDDTDDAAELDNIFLSHPLGLGGLKNAYVQLDLTRPTPLPPETFTFRPATPAQRQTILHLANGPTLTTDWLIRSPRRAMARTRQWRRWFQQCALTPNDRLQFVRRGPFEYDIAPQSF